MSGSLQPDFQPIEQLLRRQLERFPGGAAVCVYHRGKCVVDLWGGARDRKGTPWTRDTMAPSYSTTKGVASTLVHIMADRGLVDYDAPVADYWPEFAQAGKARITLRQVLAHQSGLYHIRQMIDHVDRMLDWEHMIHAIEKAEPIHEPGKRTGYHGLTFGFIVGEILQRVTGRPFSELVKREIAEPLGLDGLYIGAPSKVLDRAAELMQIDLAKQLDKLPVKLTARQLGKAAELTARAVSKVMGFAGFDLNLQSLFDALAPRGISSFDFGSPESLRVSIPAGNGLFTARSLARMYAALAAGGEIDGVRLLSRRMLNRARRPQAPTRGLSVLPVDMRWRLGYHGIPTMGGFGFAREAFGHFGFGGSGAWADPKRNLSFAMIVNAGMGTPFGDLRIVRMSTAVFDCADGKRSFRESLAWLGQLGRSPSLS